MRDGLPVPGLGESLTTASPMAFFDGEVPLEWERAEKLAASQQEHMAHKAAHSSAPHAGPSGGWLPFSEDERGTQALACLRQCAPLLRSTGMRPPWCKAVDAFQAEHCERT